MKKLFSAIAFLCISMAVLAIPANRGVYKTLTLNDGSKVRAMLVGDEHGHFWKGDDGKAYVLNGDAYQAVEIETVWEQANTRRTRMNTVLGKRLSRRKAFGERNTYYGKKKGIIILTNFADCQFVAEHDNALYQRIANEKGFHEGEFIGSIADYFKAQSFGLFELDFDVFGPVTVSHNVAYYGSDDDRRAIEMVAEAVRLVKEQVSDWTQYDWDNDGEVDQVYVVYAGRGESDTGIEELIWPHTYSFIWSKMGGFDIEPEEVAPGLIVNTYACGAELKADYRIFGTGLICHEFSHCLGYPDFYPTTYSGGQGMSYWDLMCYGCHNGGSYIPAGFTSFERWSAGWLEPVVLEEEDVTVENMQSLQKSNECYVIYNKGNRDEYYLLENRQLEGWDAAIPSPGLLIIHVDYDHRSWVTNSPNNDINHQRMTVVPADGEYLSTLIDGSVIYDRENYKTDPFPQGEVTAFNKRFKTYDEQAKNAARLYNANADGNYWIDSSVEQITQNTDGTISFCFIAHDNGPDPTGIQVIDNRQQDMDNGVYDLSGRRIPLSSVFYKGFYIKNGKKLLR